MPKALIHVPAEVKKGEVFEVKTLISHPMEPGVRRDNMGQLIPRSIITRFTCTYNGDEVFRADLFPAIAANPFITFFAVATVSGELVFQWTGDGGFTQTETAKITVL